jgi:lipoate-protein ligase A
MAWDEGLLEAAARIRAPVLRFYGWTEPAATFGYFQRMADVARMTRLRPLLRRPTGGGLVLHDADWTYSLIVPPAHSWYQLKALESYRTMHEWIRAAFHRLGTPTDLSPVTQGDRRGQCFLGAERFDVMREGLKVAGAAQRRNRHGLLIQGSVRAVVGLRRSAFEAALLQEARDQWQIEWISFNPDATLRERVESLAAKKYSREEYNGRR